MAQNIKGEDAIKILRDPEIHKCFTDSDNPVTKQVIYPLSDWFFNKEDVRKIEKADKEDGPITAAAELLKFLIKCYKDQPEILTLADFIEALKNQNANVKLVEILYSKIEGPSKSASKSDSPVIKNIKARLQFMCENVAKAWGRLLSETSLEKCFVQPKIVEEEMGEDGKKRRKQTGKSIKSYEQLFEFDTFGARIVIDGDPGIGKTTYVNKIALDWTWDEGTTHYSDGSHFLHTNFTVVFLIPLHTINGGKSATLAQAAEIQLRGCGSWVTNKFVNYPANSLLILDAFDEYDGSCQEVNEIIAGLRFPQLTVIITTRPSHIQRLEKGPQWLSITGLTTKEKREQFLVKQGWDKLLERDMIHHVLSGFCPLWNTPLYLAMLCVLYKAKKVTNFEPRHPGCFHVLVKLFTEHIMSRCVKEKGLQLSGEERLKLKSYLQQCAFQQFSENNPWLSSALKSSCHFLKKAPVEDCPSISRDIATQAGKIGLLVIRAEQSPNTGEDTEIVSFIHQMFAEYYAAIEFGPIFNNYTDKDELVRSIDENLDMTSSPFSYFLAAECISCKQMLIKKQIDSCASTRSWYQINISKFPWIPEIDIYDGILEKVPNGTQWLVCECSLDDIKSFWDIHYVKKICSIARPTVLTLKCVFLGFHDDALDDILSSVNQLKLYDCNSVKINMPINKVYRDLTELECTGEEETGQTVLLRHFENLHKLEFAVQITNGVIWSFCDSLQSLNQLSELRLIGCFESSQSVSHVIQFAKRIETSSLWKTLKELEFSWNILDTETESSTECLFNAISKCVQLEEFKLHNCQMKAQSLIVIKDILETSDNLKNSLKWLKVAPIMKLHEYLEPEQRTQIGILQDELTNWKSEIDLILLSRCNVCISLF